MSSSSSARQLQGVDCVVEIADLRYLRKADGTPIKDVNDLVELDPTQNDQLDGLFSFEPSQRVRILPPPQKVGPDSTTEPIEEEREVRLYQQYAVLKPKLLIEATRKLPPELISGILYQGRRMLVTGGSKSGKSWLLHQTAYCLANGLPLLDRFATKTTRVFYVNFELLEAGSALRFDAIKESLGQGTEDNITIISISDYLDLLTTNFAEYLALLARDSQAGAVEVDPMWRLLGERDENSNTAIGQLLRPLVRFSREAHASMIGAHHHAKGNAGAKDAIDQASVAGAFIRDPTTVFVMSPDKQDDAYIITVKTNDFRAIDRFVIRFEYPLFLIDESLDPADVRESPRIKTRKTDPQLDKVVFAIRVADQDGGLKHADIVQTTQILKGTVTKILKRLMAEKKVYKTKVETGERYALTAWFRAKMDADALDATENGEEL